jgi:hypothetical protein
MLTIPRQDVRWPRRRNLGFSLEDAGRCPTWGAVQAERWGSHFPRSHFIGCLDQERILTGNQKILDLAPAYHWCSLKITVTICKTRCLHLFGGILLQIRIWSNSQSPTVCKATTHQLFSFRATGAFAGPHIADIRMCSVSPNSFPSSQASDMTNLITGTIFPWDMAVISTPHVSCMEPKCINSFKESQMEQMSFASQSWQTMRSKSPWGA